MGNPIASGSAEHVEAADGVALRLVETRGRTTDVASDRDCATSTPRSGSTCWSSLEGPPATRCACTATRSPPCGPRLNLPRILDAEQVTLAPDAEAAQPLYARYWLHNRGPAPLGGLPAVAHLHPHTCRGTRCAGALRLTAASDCTDAALHGRVRLVCPPGWTAEPASCHSYCRPGSTWRRPSR